MDAIYLRGDEALAFLRRTFGFIGWEEARDTSEIYGRHRFVADDGHVAFQVCGPHLGGFDVYDGDGEVVPVPGCVMVDVLDVNEVRCIVEQIIMENGDG
jgi:hypothetical protein